MQAFPSFLAPWMTLKLESISQLSGLDSWSHQKVCLSDQVHSQHQLLLLGSPPPIYLSLSRHCSEPPPCFSFLPISHSGPLCQWNGFTAVFSLSQRTRKESAVTRWLGSQDFLIDTMSDKLESIPRYIITLCVAQRLFHDKAVCEGLKINHTSVR